MKSILLTLSLFVGLFAAQAQNGKVTERNLRGLWKLKIVISDNLMEREIAEEENVFARMMMSAAGNLVEGVMDNIDIEMEFLSDNRCKIYVEAFGADEIEYTNWRINRNGDLIIEDSDSFSMGDDEYWKFDDDVLVAYDDHGRAIDDEDAYVYMVKIDD